jgi:hypothetical protein
MKNSPDNRCGRHVRDPEVELQRLNHRFVAVSTRYFRAVKLRRFLRQAYLPALAALGSFALYSGLMSLSPWSQGTALKHLAAFPNCAAAQLVGLAPAYKGGPGYY